MEQIFRTSSPWLTDFQSDEAFIGALQRERLDMHSFDGPDSNRGRAIPTDPDNLFPLKIRFADMVRGCSVPESSDLNEMHRVDENTVRKLAQLGAIIDDQDELNIILYSLAIHTFLNGLRFGKYRFYYDNQRFREIQDDFQEKNEREKALASSQELNNLPHINSPIAEQSFDWFGHIRFDLENSQRCNRMSECHHHEHDEHGASEHTYIFMLRAFGNIETIGDYVLQERAVLLQIKNNQTKWVKKVLRYSLLYIQEIRRITNENLAHKIPDDVNSDLFLELQAKDWFCRS